MTALPALCPLPPVVVDGVKLVRGLTKLSSKAGTEIFGLSHPRVLGLMLQVRPAMWACFDLVRARTRLVLVMHRSRAVAVGISRLHLV